MIQIYENMTTYHLCQ